MATPPGWYPDPKQGQQGQQGLRWWDGNRWTDYVAPNTAQPPPAPSIAYQHPQHQQHQQQAPQLPPEKPKRIRKAGRHISWMAFGTFVVLVGVIGITLTRQDVEYVDVKGGKVGFIGTKRVEVAKVEESSDDLQRRIEQLETKAKNNAVSGGQSQGENGAGGGNSSGTEATTVVDLTGNWFGANDFRYRIEQFGNEVVVSEIHPVYGTTGVGDGTFDGDTLTMDFVVADGSSGHAELRLDGPDRLRGTFVNTTNGSRLTVVLTRGD